MQRRRRPRRRAQFSPPRGGAVDQRYARALPREPFPARAPRHSAETLWQGATWQPRAARAAARSTCCNPFYVPFLSMLQSLTDKPKAAASHRCWDSGCCRCRRSCHRRSRHRYHHCRHHRCRRSRLRRHPIAAATAITAAIAAASAVSALVAHAAIAMLSAATLTTTSRSAGSAAAAAAAATISPRRCTLYAAPTPTHLRAPLPTRSRLPTALPALTPHFHAYRPDSNYVALVQERASGVVCNVLVRDLQSWGSDAPRLGLRACRLAIEWPQRPSPSVASTGIAGSTSACDLIEAGTAEYVACGQV